MREVNAYKRGGVSPHVLSPKLLNGFRLNLVGLLGLGTRSCPSSSVLLFINPYSTWSSCRVLSVVLEVAHRAKHLYTSQNTEIWFRLFKRRRVTLVLGRLSWVVCVCVCVWLGGGGVSSALKGGSRNDTLTRVTLSPYVIPSTSFIRHSITTQTLGPNDDKSQ